LEGQEVKIILESEDVTFSTLSGPYGRYRALLVQVNGKQFFTTRTVEPFREQWEEPYAKEKDELLVRNMEFMLTRLFNLACAAVPEGVDFSDEAPKDQLLRAIKDAQSARAWHA
jgi:hypothetical protein